MVLLHTFFTTIMPTTFLTHHMVFAKLIKILVYYQRNMCSEGSFLLRRGQQDVL